MGMIMQCDDFLIISFEFYVQQEISEKLIIES